jgi:uncharacterized membrane protein
MATMQAMPIGAEKAPVEVRHIHMSDLRAALREGWEDFKEKRGDILIVGFLYPLVGLAVAALALNDRLVPLAFPLCAGLSLLGPAVAVGFYELARRRERGEQSDWSHFLDAFDRGGTSIMIATLMLAVVFAAWLAVAWLLYTATFGTGTFYMWSVNHGETVALQDFVSRLFTTADGWTLILLGNLAGACFAVLVLAMSVVTFPMLVDRRVDVATAMSTSLRAFAANWRVLLGWGAIVGALLVLGSIPAFVGLAVVLPVLGYATWHLYTRIVPR